jgi:hypothetical protein
MRQMKTEKEISRRRVLEMYSTLDGIVAYGNLNSLFAQDKRILTEEQALGPFYPIKRQTAYCKAPRPISHRSLRE